MYEDIGVIKPNVCSTDYTPENFKKIWGHRPFWELSSEQLAAWNKHYDDEQKRLEANPGSKLIPFKEALKGGANGNGNSI